MTFGLARTHSAKTGADLDDGLWISNLEGDTREGSYALAFQFIH
jgi:hypothetical protein